MTECLRIELGDGTTLISDIYAEDGTWCGIAISDGQAEVGAIVDAGRTEEDLQPILTIKTDNPESLGVLIQAAARAQARLIGLQYLAAIQPHTPETEGSNRQL